MSKKPKSRKGWSSVAKDIARDHFNYQDIINLGDLAFKRNSLHDRKYLTELNRISTEYLLHKQVINTRPRISEIGAALTEVRKHAIDFAECLEILDDISLRELTSQLSWDSLMDAKKLARKISYAATAALKEIRKLDLPKDLDGEAVEEDQEKCGKGRNSKTVIKFLLSTLDKGGPTEDLALKWYIDDLIIFYEKLRDSKGKPLKARIPYYRILRVKKDGKVDYIYDGPFFRFVRDCLKTIDEDAYTNTPFGRRIISALQKHRRK